MNTFESYATKIIESLPPTDSKHFDGYPSSMERAFEKFDTKSVEIIQTNEESFISDFGSPLNDNLNVVEIENAILSVGFEALAFYKSIHFQNKKPFNGKWGIFVFDYAIKYLSNEIEEFYPNKFSVVDRKVLAFKILYNHEQFHFVFDSWAISQESAVLQPLYENYRNSVYLPHHPTNLVVEESLANLFSLKRMSKYGIYSFVKRFMINQEGAYSNFFNKTEEEFLSILAAQTFHGNRSFLQYPRQLPEHVPFIANVRNKRNFIQNCPVYLVQNASPSIFLTPGISLPSLQEIERGFISSYLNGKQINRTDHQYYKIDNQEKVKLPNPHNKTLKLHEFSNIIKKAGLRQKEFYDEREKTKNWKINVPRKEIRTALI